MKMTKIILLLASFIFFFCFSAHPQEEYLGGFYTSPDGKRHIQGSCDKTDCNYAVTLSPGTSGVKSVIISVSKKDWSRVSLVFAWSSDSRFLACVKSFPNHDKSSGSNEGLKSQLSIFDFKDPMKPRNVWLETTTGSSEMIYQLPPIIIDKEFGGIPKGVGIGFTKTSFFYLVNDDARSPEKWDKPNNARLVEVSLSTLKKIKTKKGFKVRRVYDECSQ